MSTVSDQDIRERKGNWKTQRRPFGIWGSASIVVDGSMIIALRAIHPVVLDLDAKIHRCVSVCPTSFGQLVLNFGRCKH
jgi:hypothetical protein